MALRPREYASASTLAGLIGQVRDAFGEMGDATAIMVGKVHLKQGVGSPGARVLFVPEPRGSTGDPIKMGSACSITHSCTVYVRAQETGDDLTRFDNAYLLGDRVIDCVATAAPGRISWGDYSDNSPADEESFGAELVFSFSYRRDVRHDEIRWSLPAATADATARLPVIPPGESPAETTITVTTTAED